MVPGPATVEDVLETSPWSGERKVKGGSSVPRVDLSTEPRVGKSHEGQRKSYLRSTEGTRPERAETNEWKRKRAI